VSARKLALLLGIVGCGGSAAGQVISVGGTYQTEVTLLEKSCADMGVQQHPTTITHQPGDSILSVTHAGATYQARLGPGGKLTGEPATFKIGDATYVIVLSGQFTAQAVDIRADVTAQRTPPCGISARWHGPKDGAPNMLP